MTPDSKRQCNIHFALVSIPSIIQLFFLYLHEHYQAKLVSYKTLVSKYRHNNSFFFFLNMATPVNQEKNVRLSKSNHITHSFEYIYCLF